MSEQKYPYNESVENASTNGPVEQLHRNPTESEIFSNFLTGDDNAAMYMFRTYNRKIFMYCTKIVNNTFSAEDITQEVWERVIRLRNQDTVEILNPGGFLFTIARNLCLNHIKSRKNTISIDDIDEHAIPKSYQPGENHVEEIVSTSLELLKFEDRELLVLNMYCGYRFDEIAGMLGISSNAVWTRASRARANLREIVSKSLK